MIWEVREAVIGVMVYWEPHHLEHPGLRFVDDHLKIKSLKDGHWRVSSARAKRKFTQVACRRHGGGQAQAQWSRLGVTHHRSAPSMSTSEKCVGECGVLLD